MFFLSFSQNGFLSLFFNSAFPQFLSKNIVVYILLLLIFKTNHNLVHVSRKSMIKMPVSGTNCKTVFKWYFSNFTASPLKKKVAIDILRIKFIS